MYLFKVFILYLCFITYFCNTLVQCYISLLPDSIDHLSSDTNDSLAITSDKDITLNDISIQDVYTRLTAMESLVNEQQNHIAPLHVWKKLF
jgi:hypothetical protein